MLNRAIEFVLQHLSLVGFAFFGLVSYLSVRSTQSKNQYAKQLLDKAVKLQADEPPSLHPLIDEAKCLGCGACTRVCPEGDILQLIDHKAVLVGPSKCVGHGECERACPFDAISLVHGTSRRGVDIPRLNSNYETNVEGLYIAGELGGMGLIRNAVRQGAMAAKDAIRRMNKVVRTDYDLFIVGGGPAGLTASLAAIASQVRYRCIDQNSLGGTVTNFPRQKIVMSHPAELPLVGKMKFNKNKISKEELLAYWRRIAKHTGLKVYEDEKFDRLEKKGEIFEVYTSKGVYTARKVILAMGVRGSPRKLGLANEELSKVTYNLLEPDQYQNMNVAVVGGGNAGVEAAQQLGQARLNNRVTLLVHGLSLNRCNDENREKIQAMQKQGLVDIWYEANVKQIEADHLMVERAKEIVRLKNHYLLVFIGADQPHQFLMSLGVAIDKKHGERVRKII